MSSFAIYKYKSYDLNCLCFECVTINNYCSSHRCEFTLTNNNTEFVIDKLLLETLCDPLNTYFLCNKFIIFRGPAYKLLYFTILTRIIGLTGDIARNIIDYL